MLKFKLATLAVAATVLAGAQAAAADAVNLRFATVGVGSA
jgi:hypothetical protein